MDRSNPYEAAFEAYLTEQGLCYVGVDVKKRSLLAGTPVKNLDFIVLGLTGAKLLIDVKGRQFPGGPAGKERYVWENWSTQEDIRGLGHWMDLFGPGYLGLFVFLYHVLSSVELPADTPDLWHWQGARYLVRAVTVAEYSRHMKVRSPRWGTVGLPGAVFRDLARPFRYFSHEMPMEVAWEDDDQDRDLSAIMRLVDAPGAAGGTAAGSGRR